MSRVERVETAVTVAVVVVFLGGLATQLGGDVVTVPVFGMMCALCATILLFLYTSGGGSRG